MSNLPTGTVTLLFTDIEGSTRLLQQLGDRYASVLEDCRRLIRTAIARWNGHEVDTQGDSFFAPRVQSLCFGLPSGLSRSACHGLGPDCRGGKAAMRFTARGTHKGEFQGIPPTGKQVTLSGINIQHIVDGKIVENWVSLDALGMLQQLGVLPPMG